MAQHSTSETPRCECLTPAADRLLERFRRLMRDGVTFVTWRNPPAVLRELVEAGLVISAPHHNRETRANLVR